MKISNDAGLVRALGGKPSILAQAEGPDDVALIGTRTHLAVRRGGEWEAFGWHEVERGSWRGETKTFRWTTMDAEKHEAVLDEEGRMPELFKERVDASTVSTHHYDLPRGDVRIVVRRSLDAAGEMKFYAVASRGAKLSDPETRALVVHETDRIRAEYGLD